MWTGLGELPGVTRYGPPPGRPRTPTVSFTVAGRSSQEVATALAAEGVFVSNGDFYATTVVERLGLTAEGLVRAGCACYTTADEVDRLLAGVERLTSA
jgi:selenocysteine lyase/cysteine desulfurase